MRGLDVFAFCTEAAGEAVAQAVGVEPLMSPPLQAGDLGPEDLEGRDVLYFRLHELPGVDDVWFGETAGPKGGLVPAMRLGLLDRVRLAQGAVVIIGNCHSASSRFVEAFYAAGAAVVVAGPGENMAAARVVRGVDTLAKWIVGSLRAGLPVRLAVLGARTRVRATGWRRSDRDAAEFDIVKRREESDGKAV